MLVRNAIMRMYTRTSVAASVAAATTRSVPRNRTLSTFTITRMSPTSTSSSSTTSEHARTNFLSSSATTSTTVPEEQHRLQQFRKFYEMISKTTELPITALGYGGSERILNNEMLHKTPWQASCVELRERHCEMTERVLSYGQIDFAALRQQARRSGSSATSSSRRSYANVDSESSQDGSGHSGPVGLDVVHYFETSTPGGLAGYQHVAMQVRKGQLPGSCTNYSAEGGFGVWVVPHNVYVAMLNEMGLIGE